MQKFKKSCPRVAAILLSLMMMVVFVPTFAFAADAGSITVFLTVSDKGELAKAKDGSPMAWKEVKVNDIDGDGLFMFDEALVAAHDTYFEGGASKGYDPGSGFVEKLWGKETSNVLFFTKDEGLSTGVTGDEVANGDYLVASINADEDFSSDWYSFFDKKDGVQTQVDSPVTLTLTGHLGMAYTDEAKKNVPIKGAAVKTADGKSLGTTDGSGKVNVSFDKPGTYIVTAAGTHESVIEPWMIMNANMGTDADGNIPFGIWDWDTFEFSVGYTDADNGTGPYPAKDIKYIDYLEEADESSPNDYAYQDLHYMKSNQVISDCPLIAPVCVVTVAKADSKMTVSGKTAKIKFKKLKKKTQKLAVSKVLKVQNASGTVTYVKKSGNKKIKINKKTGKVTVKKKLKKGTYKVKVKVTDSGNDAYNGVEKVVTFKIKVKK